MHVRFLGTKDCMEPVVQPAITFLHVMCKKGRLSLY